MPALNFRGRICIVGVNPYVLVSAARAKRVKPDWRKPLPVLVRVNGHPVEAPWRINMMPKGAGAFYLYLHGDVRRASGTKVGDMVRIELAFDEDYRGGPTRMPDWFRAPLRRNEAARKAWEELSPSRQKEIVRYLSRLKSRVAQKRNLERALAALSGEPTRYLARTWGKSGSSNPDTDAPQGRVSRPSKRVR